MIDLPLLLAFAAAASLLTVTPGVDTAIVLRTTTLEGRRQAVLASIGQRSETHVAITGSHSFAVSVLAADQRRLADCFAQATTAAKLQRFCDAPWHEGETGSPILDGAIAFFDCRLVAQHPGGDHTIFIGEIVGAGYDEAGEPLIWYGSRYRQLSPEEPI